MARIEGEIVIGRPVEVVFDYVADQRNEPQYNPRMVRAEKITGGPVGKGTRFSSAVMSRGHRADMVIELTGYERPVRLAQVTTMAQADMSGTLTFEPVGTGTRMRWSWRVRPKGAVKLLAPVIAPMGRHQERTVWTAMKQHLEASQAATTSAGTATE
jgi:hypothetical protein